jgi:hypothetical protein
MMASVAPMAIAPFCLGVMIHLGLFIRGEWHNQAPHIIIAHTLVLTLLSGKSMVSGVSIWYGVALPFLMYLCGLFGSMAVYRLFFHRLRSFPGPRMAALTKLWHVWHCRNSQNHLLLESCYQKYGNFVRTGLSPSHQLHAITFIDLFLRPERDHHCSCRRKRMARRAPESQC